MECLHSLKPHESTLLEGQVQKSACRGSTALTWLSDSCCLLPVAAEEAPALIEAAHHPRDRGSHRVLFPLPPFKGCFHLTRWGTMNQGCPGLGSLGQGQVQPGGLARDDTSMYVSLHFWINSQWSKSRSLRFVPLFFLFRGISQLCSCLSRESSFLTVSFYFEERIIQTLALRILFWGLSFLGISIFQIFQGLRLL